MHFFIHWEEGDEEGEIQPNMKLRDIQDVVHEKFALNISAGKASRAREKAREYVNWAYTQ